MKGYWIGYLMGFAAIVGVLYLLQQYSPKRKKYRIGDYSYGGGCGISYSESDQPRLYFRQRHLPYASGATLPVQGSQPCNGVAPYQQSDDYELMHTLFMQ